jgi:amidophosphoribosyltransferase
MMAQDDKLHDECGVFGIYNQNDFDTAHMIYYGLHALQHRGQESAGIAINDSGKIICHKEMGMVPEIFDEVVLNHLHGKVGIGHVCYGKESDNLSESIQPLVMKYTKGHMSIASNGTLINSQKLRKEYEDIGYFFQTSSHAEIMALLISRQRIKTHSIEDAIVEVMKILKGSYSFLVMTPRKLIGVRDPRGMRPLCIGKKEDSYVLCSETVALDTIGAEFVRDVNPGEIVIIEEGKLRSIQTEVPDKSAMCIFEFVYISRTDSDIDGANVYKTRYNAGKMLAKQASVAADIVIGVPDSGLAAAMGYAAESGIPYGEGFIKNRYIGRTFIQPSQELREISVSIKLNAIRSQIEGKRVIMIDDSIVRGTTSKKIVNMLREIGGAKEVHVRISSPPVKYPCFYGVDIPDKEVLVANNYDLDGICKLIGADSLEFLSVEGLLKTPEGAKCNFCSACFDNIYPIGIEEEV